MAANLINYLPGVLRDVREFKSLCNAENPEVDSVMVAIDSTLNNQFIGYLDDYGCARWESMLDIKPLDTDTLQERNFRILARVNEQLPYTYRSLEERLRDLCGEQGFTVDMDKARYILYVRIAQSAKKNFNAVVELLDRITPCNLILNVSLLYNQHSKIAGFTHAQLMKHTYAQVREEENL